MTLSNLLEFALASNPRRPGRRRYKTREQRRLERQNQERRLKRLAKAVGQGLAAGLASGAPTEAREPARTSPPADLPLLLSVKQVEKLMGVREDTIRKMVDRGEIPGVVRVGRTKRGLRFHRETLLAGLAKKVRQ
jgi:excisionase family DNA binding protein